MISGAQGVSLPCSLVAGSSKQEQTCNCSALGPAGRENTRQEGLQDLGRACRWLGGPPLFLTGASPGNVPHRDPRAHLTPAFAQGFLCLAVVFGWTNALAREDTVRSESVWKVGMRVGPTRKTP